MSVMAVGTRAPAAADAVSLRVTDNLSPYIDAAPREEQKYFLATQQADEARHSVFFKRFLHEVVGRGDGSVAGVLAATRAELTWGHRQVFARLDRMAGELRRDHSPRMLAAAVTLYHVVVEASLAQPGQHMIEDYLERYDVLPRFRDGEAGAASLEQRLRAIGLPVLDLPRFPMPMDIPPRERALRGQKLLRANLIGPGDGPVRQDPEAVAIMFDTLARQADPRPVPPGTTIAWAFDDAAPWHVVLDPAGSRALPGPAPRADLTIHSAFADWADVAAGGADARTLMLRRRLRPRGRLRVLWALPRIMA